MLKVSILTRQRSKSHHITDIKVFTASKMKTRKEKKKKKSYSPIHYSFKQTLTISRILK